jgi:hypothetical protein
METMKIFRAESGWDLRRARDKNSNLFIFQSFSIKHHSNPIERTHLWHCTCRSPVRTLTAEQNVLIMSKSAALPLIVLLALTCSIIAVSVHESGNQLKNRPHDRIVHDSGSALETSTVSFTTFKLAQNSVSPLRFLKRIVKDTYMRATLIFLLIFRFTQLEPDTIVFLALMFAASVKAARYRVWDRGPVQLLEVIILFVSQLMTVLRPNAKISPMPFPVFIWATTVCSMAGLFLASESDEA